MVSSFQYDIGVFSTISGFSVSVRFRGFQHDFRVFSFEHDFRVFSTVSGLQVFQYDCRVSVQLRSFQFSVQFKCFWFDLGVPGTISKFSVRCCPRTRSVMIIYALVPLLTSLPWLVASQPIPAPLPFVHRRKTDCNVSVFEAVAVFCFSSSSSF